MTEKMLIETCYDILPVIVPVEKGQQGNLRRTQKKHICKTGYRFWIIALNKSEQGSLNLVEEREI